MRGKFIINRQLLYDDIWLCEKFSRGQAWIDLIGLANFKDTTLIKRGIKLSLKRGSIGWSEDRLANRWQWSRGKVRRFIQQLAIENLIVIEQQNNKLTTIISIVNYDSLQRFSTTNDTANSTLNDTTNGISNDTTNSTVIIKETKETTFNKEEKGSDRTPTVLKKQFLEFVFLTDNEYQKLVIQYGEQDTQKMIDKLNAQKGATGKKYKSDYHAIGYWVKDWLNEEKGKESRAAKFGEKQPKIPPKTDTTQPDYTVTSFY